MTASWFFLTFSLTGLWGRLSAPEEMWRNPYQLRWSDSVRQWTGDTVLPSVSNTTLHRFLSGAVDMKTLSEKRIFWVPKKETDQRLIKCLSDCLFECLFEECSPSWFCLWVSSRWRSVPSPNKNLMCSQTNSSYLPWGTWRPDCSSQVRVLAWW